MSAKVIRLPVAFRPPPSTAKVESTQPVPPSSSTASKVSKSPEKTEVTRGFLRKAHVVFFTVLTLGWKIWRFFFIIALLYEGVLALAYQNTPDTYCGVKFVIISLLFLGLNVSRFIKPRDF